MKTLRNRPALGILLLSIWLILHGLVSVVHLGFEGLGLVMGVLALAAGVLLLLGR